MKISLVNGLIALGVVVAGVISVRWWLEANQVYEFVIATGAETGEYYAMGQAIAKVVQKHNPRIRITVKSTVGSKENLELLGNQSVQLAIAQIDIPAPPSARSIASLYPEVFHLIVRANSPIKAVTDLRQRSFATPIKGSGSYQAFWSMMEHYGIRQQDMKIAELNTADAKLAFEQNKVEGFFQVIALNNQALRQFLQKTGAKLVPIEQASAMKILAPYLDAGIIPKGTYQAFPPIPAQDLPTVSVQAILYTNEAISEDVIREITTILYEKRSDLIAENPRTATIAFPSTSNQNLGIPLHPGAKAYYDREKPSFLQENAEPMALIITLITISISLVLNLKARLSDAQKNRADGYNLEIAVLVEQIHRTEDPKELGQIRSRLLDIFNKVIKDLDLDKLSPESYQLFVFPWQMAITALRHKELIIAQKESASNISATILTALAALPTGRETPANSR
jgi:TRAP transporter TAXI family solute receptor